MTESSPSHARAVALFAALTDAPVDQLCAQPSAVARASGRPVSTGRRAAAEAEAVGLLQRDIDMTYRRGPLALRIGLSAMGFGDLARMVDPILIELRRSLQVTACLAVAEGRGLHIGPFSLGRGPAYIHPSPDYLMASPIDGDGPETLRLFEGSDQGRSSAIRALVIGHHPARHCLLAVFPGADPALQSAEIDTALRRARARLSQSETPDI
ncbi:hypothetical protein E2K80_04350 [Rhodophyticola sp. CCM32]|uniref:hypothetical protein n=1 Tax=Rhodophyticola sp. CCM32 TaxID=2916397 RepID=UPI00107F47B5|nr:hypothetical protein [Rhodophyticola sp. CCM32]QBY00066.1 hypothetical protein E2K80_04350 [Rhodophyticola sp. CCM32]